MRRLAPRSMLFAKQRKKAHPFRLFPHPKLPGRLRLQQLALHAARDRGGQA